jgi:hypothetical protein
MRNRQKAMVHGQSTDGSLQYYDKLTDTFLLDLICRLRLSLLAFLDSAEGLPHNPQVFASLLGAVHDLLMQDVEFGLE